MSYSAENIRNICLLGHSGVGKTMLAERQIVLSVYPICLTFIFLQRIQNPINKNIVPLHIVFVNKKTTKYSVITGEKAKIPQGKCPVG